MDLTEKILPVSVRQFHNHKKNQRLHQQDIRLANAIYHVFHQRRQSDSWYAMGNSSILPACIYKRIGVDPGGDIMVHGQKNGYGQFSASVQRFNWTNGCIALSDKDMDLVWKAVKPGTPIEIRPYPKEK
jgi:uncharacterized protein YdaL